METSANREKLAGFERVKRIHLTEKDFTIESGLLTTTLKLKRNFAKELYAKDINSLYSQVADSKL